MAVQSSYTEEGLQQFLWRERLLGKTLRAIAQESFGGRVTHGDIARALRGELPAGREKRAAFGLPVVTAVLVMGGSEIPPGAQVIATAERCDCGQWFIPNHPARRRCFICSPYRRRKKRLDKGVSVETEATR